jgi:hypothetical protein
MFTVFYHNFGNTYSTNMTREQAEEEIFDYGYPSSRKELSNFSDRRIQLILNEIYNPV